MYQNTQGVTIFESGSYRVFENEAYGSAMRKRPWDRYAALAVLVNHRQQILAKRLIQVSVRNICSFDNDILDIAFGQILAEVVHQNS